MARKYAIRRRHPAAELNITAFMNLMVVLVPFLLMTAVFSHITILDLNLPPPGGSDTKQPEKPPFELRLTIRKTMIVVSDSRGGLIKRIPKSDKTHNYTLLQETLKQVKARFPGTTGITILAEQDTQYDDLIQAMDSARSYQTMYQNELVIAELFPDISIGDAANH